MEHAYSAGGHRREKAQWDLTATKPSWGGEAQGLVGNGKSVNSRRDKSGPPSSSFSEYHITLSSSIIVQVLLYVLLLGLPPWKRKAPALWVLGPLLGLEKNSIP